MDDPEVNDHPAQGDSPTGNQAVRTSPAREELHDVATRLFGSEDADAVSRWVDYWGETHARNQVLLETFQPLALLDLKGKRVLDVGCGTGGMGQVVGQQAALYVGLDATHHVIRFASRGPGLHFVEGNGSQLPLADDSFDVIFALDVLEHVQGGRQAQIDFLSELRRVLHPLGMIYLATPNRLYPFEGHTDLFAPQYLPRFLRDRYVRRFNPGFLKEHSSFDEITSLTPAAFRACLDASSLSFLHELPCGMDRSDYLRNFPFRGLLGYAGLGWYPHAEFWGVLVAKENLPQLRLKIRKNWTDLYPHLAPAETDFSNSVDFDCGECVPQLGGGWHAREEEPRGFRWTSGKSVCHVQTGPGAQFLCIHGYAARENRLTVRLQERIVGETVVGRHAEFRLRYLWPEISEQPTIWSIELECGRTFRSDDPDDRRDLGVMIFSISMLPERAVAGTP